MKPSSLFLLTTESDSHPFILCRLHCYGKGSWVNANKLQPLMQSQGTTASLFESWLPPQQLKAVKCSQQTVYEKHLNSWVMHHLSPFSFKIKKYFFSGLMPIYRLLIMGEAVQKKLAFLMLNDHRSATNAKLCHLSPA